jgi:very-short-patch-repair endonuclease
VPVAPDRSLAQLALPQFGVFTRAQANAVDVSNEKLQARVKRGSIERLSRDVFAIAGAPPSWHQRLLAAAWGGGDDCCVSHRAASALHSYDGFQSGIVEVVHHQRRDYRVAPGAIVHVTSVLDACDRTTWGPIPVTTPIRTLIDLGAVVPIERLEEALDSAERNGLVDRDALSIRLDQIRQSGRNGVGPLAELLEGRAAQAETPRSVLERRMLRLLAAADLPEPRCQVRVPRGDGRVAFLDFAYPAVRIGLELDGHAWHATPRQRQRDHERQNMVVIADWTILRFTYGDVANRPEYVAAVVRQALLAGATRRDIPA